MMVARNVAIPRINEVAVAAGKGMFPFTHSAAKSENDATNNPARTANILVLPLVPMRRSYAHPIGLPPGGHMNSRHACRIAWLSAKLGKVDPHRLTAKKAPLHSPGDLDMPRERP